MFVGRGGIYLLSDSLWHVLSIQLDTYSAGAYCCACEGVAEMDLTKYGHYVKSLVNVRIFVVS